MELRQLRYFIRIVELGSMGRAALELGVVTSTLSQQISRLEGELSTRLLQRLSNGIVPTDAGLAFLQQAQLTIRHADDAVRAAQWARLSGHVSVGMAPSTSAVLGLPFMSAMRQRYPDIRLHIVESLSGNLASMVAGRRLDIAILFHVEQGQRWGVTPLLDERLFVMAKHGFPGMPAGRRVRLERLGKLPLLLPSGSHDLRAQIDAAAARTGCKFDIVAEIDGLSMLMDAVLAGMGATIQPGAAIARLAGKPLSVVEVSDPDVYRCNLLAVPADDELSSAGLAARGVISGVARALVEAGEWPGATLHRS
jgi:LysR family tcuABC transcriptional regulator